MEHTCQQYLHRGKQTLASLDVTRRHVHETSKSRLTRVWYVQSWSIVAQFGIPNVYFFKINLRRRRKEELDLLQITGNYTYETETFEWHSILEQLKWESLKKRRKDSRVIMLYKGLKGVASIPTNDLVLLIRRTRNHHTLACQTESG